MEGLRVSTVETDQPTLVASRVEIRHDLVALASGIYRAEAITIASARIVTRETEEGAALDFPFRLEPSDTTAGLPVIRLEDATVLYRAREDSRRLRPGWVLSSGRVDWR